MLSPPTICHTCRTPTSTAFDLWGDHRCLICGEVLWEPIAWDAEGITYGWLTRTSVTFWRNVPPEAKLVCSACGFSWLRVVDVGTCPCCQTPAHL